MSKFARLPRFLATLIALGLAACAGQNSAPLPLQGSVPTALSQAKTSPPACTGQTTTSLYATSATVSMGKKGGALCIPAFGGFGGTIAYPHAHPPVTVTLTSSTTNYNTLLPSLGKGKPLFYLQFATSTATSFGTVRASKKGLTGKKLVSGKSYDIYGEAKLSVGVAGITIPFTPCRATATTGPYGGVVAGMGSLMAKQKIGGPANIYIEVYKGARVKTAC